MDLFVCRTQVVVVVTVICGTYNDNKGLLHACTEATTSFAYQIDCAAPKKENKLRRLDCTCIRPKLIFWCLYGEEHARKRQD